MCTVVVSLDPSARMPLLLVGIRDELLDRPWLPPGRHWPALPLIGGQDKQAGGTWLAVHPAIPRVACVLNGRGQAAPEPFRKSRGDLPLLAASGGRPAIDRLDPGAYDPFHLVVADTWSVEVLSWDGVRVSRMELSPGTHMITNEGIDAADPKSEHFTAKFATARPDPDPDPEPEPEPGDGDAASDPAAEWGSWWTFAEGDGLPPDDPRAIRVRRVLPEGRLWGTSSVSLVALSGGGIRYDFTAVLAPAGSDGGKPNAGNSRSASRKNVSLLSLRPDTSGICSAHAVYPPDGAGLYWPNTRTPPLACPAGTRREPAQVAGSGSRMNLTMSAGPVSHSEYGGICISASSCSSLTSADMS